MEKSSNDGKLFGFRRIRIESIALFLERVCWKQSLAIFPMIFWLICLRSNVVRSSFFAMYFFIDYYFISASLDISGYSFNAPCLFQSPPDNPLQRPWLSINRTHVYYHHNIIAEFIAFMIYNKYKYFDRWACSILPRWKFFFHLLNEHNESFSER